MTASYHVLFAPSSDDRCRMLGAAMRDLGHRVSIVGAGSGANDHTDSAVAGEARSCDVLVVVPQRAGSAIACTRDATVARWRILWLDRADLACDIDPAPFDYVYVAWAHLRRPIMSRWGLASDRVLTTALGAPDARAPLPHGAPRRSPHRVAVLAGGEPSPRLATDVLQHLHEHDDRFSVEILTPSTAGAVSTASFLVAMPGAMEQCAQAVLQAKRAGVVVLAAGSETAAELILTEYDGLVLDEDARSPAFAKACAAHIARLSNDHELTARLSARAMADSLGWRAVARQWVAHWDRLAAADARRSSRPRVSVVMAAWNAAPFVQEAVDSILGQTEWDLELIAVDDGSTDATARILDGYDDARLKVIHQDNQGVWAAANRGLREARGQLIARMDADDVAHPRRIQHQLEFLEAHPRIALVGTACHKIDAAGRIFTLYPEPVDDRAIKERMPHGNPFIQPAVLMRRAVLDRVGVYRRHEAEDYDLWLRVSERFEVANLAAPLHKVRRTGQSRVAVHEKAIIDSVRHCADKALERYARGQDSEGYPPLRHRAILGVPVRDLRWSERRPYATTLMAWADAVLARDRRLALSLYVKATLLAPDVARHWRACAGCVLGIRGRARGEPRR